MLGARQLTNRRFYRRGRSLWIMPARSKASMRRFIGKAIAQDRVNCTHRHLAPHLPRHPVLSQAPERRLPHRRDWRQHASLVRTGAFRPLQLLDHRGDPAPCRGADFVALSLEDHCSRFVVRGGALSKFIEHKHGCPPNCAVVAQTAAENRVRSEPSGLLGGQGIVMVARGRTCSILS